MVRDAYDECMRVAAGYSRTFEDARDLVQTVLLSALERGVSDLAAPERRAWLRGALRRHAAFEGRLAARRRRREHRWCDTNLGVDTGPVPWQFSAEFLAQLQPSVRVLAALASADLSAHEIRSVLHLGSTAFRKRVSVLRRFVREALEAGQSVVSGGQAIHALGPMRADVIDSLRRRPQAALGSHDPDGHPLLFAVQRRTATPK